MFNFKEFFTVSGATAAIIGSLVGMGAGYGWLVDAVGTAFGGWGVFALIVLTISSAIGAMAAWSDEKKEEAP